MDSTYICPRQIQNKHEVPNYTLNIPHNTDNHENKMTDGSHKQYKNSLVVLGDGNFILYYH